MGSLLRLLDTADWYRGVLRVDDRQLEIDAHVGI